MSGGHDDRVAKGASIEAPSGVDMGRGVRSPAYYRGSGERRELPQQGPGAEPRPLSHFLRILGHRTLLVARKRASNCRRGNVPQCPMPGDATACQHLPNSFIDNIYSPAGGSRSQLNRTSRC